VNGGPVSIEILIREKRSPANLARCVHRLLGLLGLVTVGDVVVEVGRELELLLAQLTIKHDLRFVWIGIAFVVKLDVFLKTARVFELPRTKVALECDLRFVGICIAFMVEHGLVIVFRRRLAAFMHLYVFLETDGVFELPGTQVTLECDLRFFRIRIAFMIEQMFLETDGVFELPRTKVTLEYSLRFFRTSIESDLVIV
jgi:hypothetical protein